jgi:ABC-type transport system substrate-binding protein
MTSEDMGIRNVVESLTMETLVTSSTDGRPGERLATGWRWNEDRSVLHLDLRDGVLFHDGTPLTPELVAESLRTDVARHNGLALASVESINPVPHGIDVVLSSPDSFLVEDLGVTSIRKPGAPSIGTGPYKLEGAAGSRSLVAFNEYYKGAPSIPKISISSYPTQRKAWSALMRSEIDMLHSVSQDAIEFVEAESAVRAYSFPKPYYYVLAFNVRRSPLSNVAARRAINEAIDKNAIVADGLRGRARPAIDPVWPEFWSTEAGRKGVAFDPQSASDRLDKAGFSWKPSDATHPRSRFRINCLVWADDSRLVRTALLIQKQLNRVGIDVHLEAVTFNNLLPRISQGQFDMFLFEMGNGRTLSWIYRFWHSPRPDMPTNNFTGYAAADTALDAIRRAQSDDEIRVKTANLEDVFEADPPAVFLAWQTMTRAVSTQFVLPRQPGRDIMYSIWEWKPADGRQLAER